MHTVQLIQMKTALGVSEFIYIHARMENLYSLVPALLITANALAVRPQSRR